MIRTDLDDKLAEMHVQYEMQFGKALDPKRFLKVIEKKIDEKAEEFIEGRIESWDIAALLKVWEKYNAMTNTKKKRK